MYTADMSELKNVLHPIEAFHLKRNAEISAEISVWEKAYL